MGDTVHLLTEKKTKNHLPLGRIIATHAGRDGLIRSETIQLPLTANQIDENGRSLSEPKTIKRGIEGLAMLESTLIPIVAEEEETSQ